MLVATVQVPKHGIDVYGITSMGISEDGVLRIPIDDFVFRIIHEN
jgi:hypothetical protein